MVRLIVRGFSFFKKKGSKEKEMRRERLLYDLHYWKDMYHNDTVVL